MRIIAIILLIVISINSFGQNGYPQKQNLGSDSTLISTGINYNGGIKGKLINNPYTDTTSANLQNIKRYAGAQIFTSSDNNFWVRNSTATAWVSISAASARSNFLGIRYNGSSWTDLTDFVSYGSTSGITASGGNLVAASGGSTGYSVALSVPQATCLEYWKGTISFKCTSGSAALAIGLRSLQTVSPINGVVKFDNATGIASLQLGTSYSTGLSTTAITRSNGDSIVMTIERAVNILTITLVNLTNGSAVTPVSYQYQFSDGAFMPNTGQFSLYELTAGFTVYNLRYESTQPKYCDVIFRGDSKTQGYGGADMYSSFAGRAKFAWPLASTCAGGGDQVFQLSQSIQELIDLHPIAVVLEIGSNSIRNGESGYLARYDSCVTALKNAGILVYNLEPLYETSGLDQTPLENHIVSTYTPSEIIYIYYRFKDNATTYLGADNIHPNQVGYEFIYQTIINSYKVAGAKTIITPKISILNQNAITGGQAAGFDINLASRIRNKLTVGDATEGNIQQEWLLAPDQSMRIYSSTFNTLASTNAAHTDGKLLRLSASYYQIHTYNNPTETEVMTIDNTNKVYFPTIANIFADKIGAYISSTGQIGYMNVGYGLNLLFSGAQLGADTTVLMTKASAQVVSGAKNFTSLQSFSAGLNLNGSSAPLQANGSAGTTGQVVTSAGSGNTPTWKPVQFQGADVASANNLAILTDGDVFEVTGTTQINLIANTGRSNGAEITLLFTSNPVVKNGQATSGSNITIQLAGGVDFSATANDVLTLVLSEIGGTQVWREKCRSVN